MSRLPPSLKSRVLEGVRRETAPTRTSVLYRTLAVFAIALIATFAVFIAIGGVQAGARPIPLVVGTAAGWAAIAGWATWASFGRGGSMLGRPRRWLLLAASATPALLLSWLVAWDLAYPDAVLPCPLGHGMVCLALTLAMGAAPFIALLATRHGSDPVQPGLTGAALGGAAGAWGAVMIDLRCSITAPSHVALGHVLPVIVLAALGALVGRWVLAVRAD